MPEVSVNVRCSNGERFTAQVDPEATVLAFKLKIAEQAGVSPDLQRLIYKGRVMKDDHSTLASYTVEADSTVHLVRSVARSAPAPSAAPAPSPAAGTAAPASPFGVPPPPGGAGGAPGGAGGNPFAEMMGGMGAGGMDINRMQQQLMSNPEMMANIMNSPMMEGLLNNPDMLRSIMWSNPQMQQVMQNNPQLAQVLNDPATMRQYLDMARNPEALNQARRSQDLMMSQIENQPGGFNALRRLYTEVQEPMMQASDGMVDNDNAAGANRQAATPAANPSTGPNTSALPNPWAAPGAPAATPGAAGAPAPAAAAPPNPWAAFGGGMPGGMPGMPGMPPGGQFDPASMQQIMNNPMVQQMVAQMADNPAMLESMIEQNPQLQQAMQANPALRDQLPQFMRRMSDPQTVQALAQMQQSMMQLQQAGVLPAGGLPGMGGMGGMPGLGGMGGMPGMGGVGGGGDLGAGLAGLGAFGNLNLGSGAPPAAGGLDFSTLLNGARGAGAGASANPWAAAPVSTTTATPPSGTASANSSSSAAAAPPAAAQAPSATQTPGSNAAAVAAGVAAAAAAVIPPVAANPEETYAAQLGQMNDMGFTDRAACVRALVASQGNVNIAVERMLSGV